MNKKNIKKIYLISSKKNSRLIADMKRAFDNRSVLYKHIDPEYLIFDATGELGNISFFYKGEKIDFDKSYVFVSNRNRNPSLISLLIKTLNFLEVEHSAPLYEHVIETEDKHHQVINLFLHKIPIPKTIICSASAFLKNKEYFQKKFPREFVFKASGSRGDFVWKCNSFDEAVDHLGVLSTKQKEILSFQFVIDGEHASFDVRSLFFKTKCISSMKRKGEGFLNNHSKGAGVEKYTLSKEEYDICKQASLISGLDFLGIDFMWSSTGPVILELQNSPFMRGMRSTDSELNIGEELVDAIINDNSI